MRKRYYVIFVARDADGHLQKVPIPLRYAYMFLAAALIGTFTITGMAGSYGRMLLKTSHFNQLRTSHEALRRDYKQLEKVAQEKDIQAASLGSLASEVTAYYGLKQRHSTAVAPTLAPAQKKAVNEAQTPAPSEFTSETYIASLDQMYALRQSAVSGIATQALGFGSELSLSSVDWSHLASAPSLWPIEGRVTSSFGERQDPINGEGAFHAGIDISAEIGTAIHAPADGTVVSAGFGNGYGREVVIDHGNGINTRYGHLSGFAVVSGQQIHRGDTIGYVGMSGRTTGPHLHYEVRIHDTPVNPHKYMRETVAQMHNLSAAM